MAKEVSNVKEGDGRGKRARANLGVLPLKDLSNDRLHLVERDRVAHLLKLPPEGLKGWETISGCL